MKSVLISLFAILCLGQLCSAQSFSNSTSNCTVCPGIKNYWHASLLPSEVAAQVNGSSFGSLIINLEYLNFTGNFSDNLVLNYHLFMKGLNLTSAQLHLGLRCSVGPMVVLLTPNTSRNNSVSLPDGGILAEGSLYSFNLTGPLENFTIYDLIQEINEGNVYINVTSSLFPFGVVRGQIQTLQEDSPAVPEDVLSAVNCTGKFNQLMNYLIANSSNCTSWNHTNHWNTTVQSSNNQTCGNYTLDCKCRIFRTFTRNCTYNCSRLSSDSTCNSTCVRANPFATSCPRDFNTSCGNNFIQRPACNCTKVCGNNGTCPSDIRDSILARDGLFTVFAMSDAAFGWDNTTSFEPHIVEGIYQISDFFGKVTTLQTLTGAKLIVNGVQPSVNRYLKAPHQLRVSVNGVPITHPGAVVAKNGVLHGLGGFVHAQAVHDDAVELKTTFKGLVQQN